MLRSVRQGGALQGVAGVSRRRRIRMSRLAPVLVSLLGTMLASLSMATAAWAQGPPVPAGMHAASRAAIYPGGGVYSYGDAVPGPVKFGTPTTTPATLPPLNSPVMAMVALRSGGYWLAGADGGIYNLGGAPYYGSLGAYTLQGPIVAMAPTPDDKGYWLAGLDGGIFAFGDAPFYGSMGGHSLVEPIEGMAATADGKGYWLVASDGGMFAFGDATFYGSMGGKQLSAPIAGMAATPDTKGYWLVATDGGIFAFGDAGYFGSMGGTPLNDGIVGMASTPDGLGYWMVAWDGGVFTFGDAHYYGSMGSDPSGAAAPITQIVPTPDGNGYWLLGPDAFNYTFANPPPNGVFPGSAAIVAAAESQVQPNPVPGTFCNPYGPCEEWCALFATWAMEQGGVPIPSYAFTGSIFDWGQQNALVLPGTATPVPGDDVLYGTGPATTGTSRHTGIVAQVWPDGAIVTIEGDAGPGNDGATAVVLNGPFLPADSDWYNGMGIYAFVQP
jgi:hypothetical protein